MNLGYNKDLYVQPFRPSRLVPGKAVWVGGVLTDAQTAEIAATKQVAEFVHVFEAKGKESGVAERDEEALCSSGMAFFPRLRWISQVCTKFRSRLL